MRVIVAIIADEVSFWLFIVAGLCTRYLLNWRVAGAILLARTPIIDLVLLALIVIDLRGGAQPPWIHGFAALYLGSSVPYGRRLVQWADRRSTAYRAAQGRPAKPKLYGADKI